jgi:hypothetical protein
MNEVFKAYDEKTEKKLQVTYVPTSEYDARLAANPKDFCCFPAEILGYCGADQGN